MDAVRAHFRPEFLNRLDETIIFDRLARDDMAGIVTIQLGCLISGWRAQDPLGSGRRRAQMAGRRRL